MARMSLKPMLWKCRSCSWQKKEHVGDAISVSHLLPEVRTRPCGNCLLREGEEGSVFEQVKRLLGSVLKSLFKKL